MRELMRNGVMRLMVAFGASFLMVLAIGGMMIVGAGVTINNPTLADDPLPYFLYALVAAWINAAALLLLTMDKDN
jgi:hypothetical protein